MGCFLLAHTSLGSSSVRGRTLGGTSTTAAPHQTHSCDGNIIQRVRSTRGGMGWGTACVRACNPTLIESFVLDSPWTLVAGITPNMKRPSVAQNVFIEIHRNIERAIDKNTGREARVVFKGERQVVPGVRAQGSYGVGANVGVCFACDS